jgi:hypothetical protein
MNTMTKSEVIQYSVDDITKTYDYLITHSIFDELSKGVEDFMC